MDPAPDFVLYDAPHTPSPRRVKICLIEKGLPFTERWLNIGLMDQKRPDYIRLNPTGQVPTLLHNGRAIFDSNVINEYLDDLYPDPSLVPADPVGRAEMRMWFAFEADFAKPLRDAAYETTGKARLQNLGIGVDELASEITSRTPNAAYLEFASKVMTTPPDPDVVANRLSIVFEKIEVMEVRIGDGRRFLCGDSFTLADIAVAPRLDTFGGVGVHDLFDRYPRIGVWMDRIRTRPSWARSLTQPGQDVIAPQKRA